MGTQFRKGRNFFNYPFLLTEQHEPQPRRAAEAGRTAGTCGNALKVQHPCT